MRRRDSSNVWPKETLLTLSSRALALIACLALCGHAAASSLKFEISLPAGVRGQPITGRMFLIISREAEPEVRLQAGSFDSPPLFGVDVEALKPGGVTIFDASVPGYPLQTLQELPVGDYFVQALLNVYTQFRRADGHVIWAHMDQWEGQQFNTSPGNLYSEVQRLHLDPTSKDVVRLSLTEVIPPITVPADTPRVKRFKIKSEVLSRFWGRPMYLGAVVLLPRDYETSGGRRYPVLYKLGHFSLKAPFDYEHDAELQREWTADDFPRVIIASLLHPTPYYDNSFALNSANAGPYADALVQELIPHIEQQFRAVGKPYARALTGRSAGGQQSLALQLKHPELFGGMWCFAPAEIDFRRYYSIDLYHDDNAFHLPQSWIARERLLARTVEGQPAFTVRQVRQLESVLGSRGRSAFWFDPSAATYSPVASDGYPQRVFDPQSGRIDSDTVRAWRDGDYDLREYAKSNWPTLGPQLVGKLHFYVGDMDDYFGDLSVVRFEEFLQQTRDPHVAGSFTYGRPGKGHMWAPMTNAALIREMADHIARNAPTEARQ